MTQTLADEIHPKKLTRRQEVFDGLLDRYTTARATMFRGDPLAGDGEGPDGRMPVEWNWTYRELERLLRLYRRLSAELANLQLVDTGEARSGYWHLSQWYLHAKVYPQWPKQRMVQRGREQVLVQPPVRWRIERNVYVDPAAVLGGLVWLDEQWSRYVAPRHDGAEPDDPWLVIGAKRATVAA